MKLGMAGPLRLHTAEGLAALARRLAAERGGDDQVPLTPRT